MTAAKFWSCVLVPGVMVMLFTVCPYTHEVDGEGVDEGVTDGDADTDAVCDGEREAEPDADADAVGEGELEVDAVTVGVPDGAQLPSVQFWTSALVSVVDASGLFTLSYTVRTAPAERACAVSTRL